MFADQEGKRRVMLDYTNHRGQREEREVTPLALYFGSTEYHAEEQWLLLAYCHTRGAERTFAMKDVHKWELV